MASVPILVVGAGGHGRVVAEVAQSTGHLVEGFVDDGIEPGVVILGLPVLGGVEWLTRQPPRQVALGVGGNKRREEIAARLENAGHRLGTWIHSTAWVSPTAVLGAGTVVMAKAVVNAQARIGRGVIVNTGAIIEHQCVLGDFCHVSPNAALGGGSTVGARSHVGIGASLLQLARIGDDSIVGGGAVVLKQVDSNTVVAGVPARRLRESGK